MLLIRGISWPSLAGLGGTGLALAFLTYEMIPHVRSRVDRLHQSRQGRHFPGRRPRWRPSSNGGLLGTGPGGGVAKQILPDAHTDFVPAVIGEEFGFLALMVLLGLIVSVVIRVLQRAQREADPFAALAMAGLATMFGLQASINLGGEHGARPRQGHDAAVHLLWRFIARRDSLRHGTGAGDEPAPSRGGAAGGHGCNDGVR